MKSSVNGAEIVTFDGGPLIVLQAAAVPVWKGSDDWDNSRMNGGTVETDYDVICETTERLMHRYDRDMLVLDDSEWGACLISLPSDEIAVLQCFGWSEEPVIDVVNLLRKSTPSQEHLFKAHDKALRLMAGACAGTDEDYSFQEVAISSGTKRCAIYETSEALLFVLSDHSVEV